MSNKNSEKLNFIALTVTPRFPDIKISLNKSELIT